MKVINLVGGPGSTKSTIMGGLYHLMKINHHPVAFVGEYATQLVFEKRFDDLKRQDYILAKQHRAIQAVIEGGCHVITDTCMLFGLVYGEQLTEEFKRHCISLYNQYDNKVFFINRPKADSIPAYGRMHNLEQSIVIDTQITDMLRTVNVPYDIINADKLAHMEIYRRLFGEPETYPWP